MVLIQHRRIPELTFLAPVDFQFQMSLLLPFSLLKILTLLMLQLMRLLSLCKCKAFSTSINSFLLVTLNQFGSESSAPLAPKQAQENKLTRVLKMSALLL